MKLFSLFTSNQRKPVFRFFFAVTPLLLFIFCVFHVSPAFAAAGDVTPKTIGMSCEAGNGKFANAGTYNSISFNGNWPGESYTVSSYGLVPEGTEYNIPAINSAFIYLGDDPGIGAAHSGYKYLYVDLTKVSPPVTPGQYRVVVYALSGGGEEVFYSDATVQVIEGDGFVYNMSATTVEVTAGGATGDADATELTLHLRFGNSAPVSFLPSDVIYLEMFMDGGDAVDFTNATVTSPAGITAGSDWTPPEGIPLQMIMLKFGGSYTVLPGGLDVVISGITALTADEITCIIKFAHEEENFENNAALGHWESTLTFSPSPYQHQELTTGVTGLTLSGNFTPGATVTAMTGTTDNVSCPEFAEAQTGGKLIALYDISLSSGSYQGDLTVTIPVGAGHNGETVSILHCKNNTLESVDATVSDGKVSGTFSSLSPFGVALKNSASAQINLSGFDFSQDDTSAGWTYSASTRTFDITDDISVTGSVTGVNTTSGKNITIHIAADKTVAWTASYSGHFESSDEDFLVLTGSGSFEVNAGGNINNTAWGDAGIVTRGPSVVVNGGTIKGGRGIDLDASNLSVTVNSGLIEASNGAAIISYNFKNYTGSVVTVNGGQLRSAVGTGTIDLGGNNHTLNVTGGSIEQTGTRDGNNAVYIGGTSSTVNISGGAVMSAGKYAIYCSTNNVASGTVTISGGVVYGAGIYSGNYSGPTGSGTVITHNKTSETPAYPEGSNINLTAVPATAIPHWGKAGEQIGVYYTENGTDKFLPVNGVSLLPPASLTINATDISLLADGAGQGWTYTAATRTLSATENIAVSGNVTDQPVTFNIIASSGVTVDWQANYSGSTSSIVNPIVASNPLIYFTTASGAANPGTFYIHDNTISNTGSACAVELGVFSGINAEDASLNGGIKMSGSISAITLTNSVVTGNYAALSTGNISDCDINIVGSRLSSNGATVSIQQGANISLAVLDHSVIETAYTNLVGLEGAIAFVLTNNPTVTVTDSKILSGGRGIWFNPQVVGGNITINGNSVVQGIGPSLSGEPVGSGLGPVIQMPAGVTCTKAGNAVVIAYDRTQGVTFTVGDKMALTADPADAATWAKQAGKSGIAYTNGTNTGFIPITGVTVNEPLQPEEQTLYLNIADTDSNPFHIGAENGADYTGNAGKYTWDGAAKKLTLNGFMWESSAANALYITGNMTLELQGDNLVRSTSSNAAATSVGIEAFDLTVTGSGALSVGAGSKGNSNIALDADKITLAGGTLTVSGGDAASSTGISSVIEITGGTLIATGKMAAVDPGKAISVSAANYRYWYAATTADPGGAGTDGVETPFTNIISLFMKLGNKMPLFLKVEVAPPLPPTYYNVWANGERFASDHLSIACGDGTAVYDPATSTLTLTNATISTGCAIPAELTTTYCESGIFTMVDLNVILAGDNVIEDTGGTGIDSYAMDPSWNTIVSNISLSGAGSLTITETAPADGYGVYASGSLLINGVNLTINCSATGLWVGTDLSIINSVINIINTAITYHGIAVNEGDANFDGAVLISNRQPITGDYPEVPFILFGNGTDNGHGYTLTNNSLLITYDETAAPFTAGTSTGIISDPADLAQWAIIGSNSGILYENGDISGFVVLPGVTVELSGTPIAFTVPAGATHNVSAYTTAHGDIVFESDDDTGTGQLTGIPNEGLQVNGKVKLVKEFTVNKWYPVGFPFEIESVSIKQGENTWDGVIYDEDNDKVKHENINSATDDNYFVKYYDGTDNVFRFTDHFEVNKGYIIEFPIDPFEAGKVEATFTSVANPVIHSTGGTVGAYHESYYTLVVNPNVAHTGSLTDATHYYQYNYDNKFEHVNTLSSHLKPFEATVVYHGPAGSVSYQVIGAGNGTTGINPAGNDKIIRTEYYNLMGTLVGINDFSAVQSGIYIVKTVYESGKIKTVKQIIKK